MTVCGSGHMASASGPQRNIFPGRITEKKNHNLIHGKKKKSKIAIAALIKETVAAAFISKYIVTHGYATARTGNLAEHTGVF
jgi:hypothetical protein